MDLAEYIKKVGVAQFVQEFKRCGVTERAALSWMHRVRIPNVVMAQKIIAASEFTWDDIYTPTAIKKARA